MRLKVEHSAIDMASTDTFDRIIQAIDAAILVKMTGGTPQSYSIAGRSITHYSLAELTNLREFYQAKVDESSNSGGVTYADFRTE